MTELNLATVCMNSTDDKTGNVAKAEEFVRKAKALGADWVLLPELFPFHGPYDKIFDHAEKEGGPLWQKFSGLAKDLGICIFMGTIGERPPAGTKNAVSAKGFKRIYNTMYVFGRDGGQIAKYRKTHLFNLFDPKGAPLYCESDGYLAGDSAVNIDIEGFRVGLAICYDLRFPEFFARLGKAKPLDILIIPSAFTLGTGMYHWELLLRARAVEYQCYIYASNQTGAHGPGKASFGHSMIVDPWGHKLTDTGDIEGVATATVSTERIAAIRARLPALANRRPELY